MSGVGWSGVEWGGGAVPAARVQVRFRNCASGDGSRQHQAEDRRREEPSHGATATPAAASQQGPVGSGPLQAEWGGMGASPAAAAALDARSDDQRSVGRLGGRRAATSRHVCVRSAAFCCPNNLLLVPSLCSPRPAACMHRTAVHCSAAVLTGVACHDLVTTSAALSSRRPVGPFISCASC